jgi:hypothetical protein
LRSEFPVLRLATSETALLLSAIRVLEAVADDLCQAVVVGDEAEGLFGAE